MNKIGPCQNALEFSHRLDPLRTLIYPFELTDCHGRSPASAYAQPLGIRRQVQLRSIECAHEQGLGTVPLSGDVGPAEQSVSFESGRGALSIGLG